jgi:hypothetical protein
MTSPILNTETAFVYWETNWSGTGYQLRGMMPFTANIQWESGVYYVTICNARLKKTFTENEKAIEFAEKILHAWLSRGSIIMQNFMDSHIAPTKPLRTPRIP